MVESFVQNPSVVVKGAVHAKTKVDSSAAPADWPSASTASQWLSRRARSSAARGSLLEMPINSPSSLSIAAARSPAIKSGAVTLPAPVPKKRPASRSQRRSVAALANTLGLALAATAGGLTQLLIGYGLLFGLGGGAAYILVQTLRLHAAGTACATAQAPTLRERLLKVAVWVTRSVRRIVLHFPTSFPWQPEWRQIACAIGARP